MNEFQFLKADIADNIAIVAMDNPPVNAATYSGYQEIAELFGNPSRYLGDARVIVLTGQGRHFCGGNDIGELGGKGDNMPSSVPAYLKATRAAFDALFRCELPTIAAVNGAAVGTGLVYAACCDIVLASDRARFALTELLMGVMGGAKHLSRLVPQQVVRAMFLTADLMNAEEFAAHGGAYKVVPADDLAAEARALAARIARHSPLALRVAKEGLNTIEQLDYLEGYAFEQGLTAQMQQTRDAREAIKSSVEKRPPEWKGY